jgi:hypothetical protein
MRKQQKFTKLAQHCLHRYITTVDDNQGSAHVTRHKQSSGTEGMKGVKLKSSVEIWDWKGIVFGIQWNSKRVHVTSSRSLLHKHDH